MRLGFQHRIPATSINVGLNLSGDYELKRSFDGIDVGCLVPITRGLHADPRVVPVCGGGGVAP